MMDLTEELKAFAAQGMQLPGLCLDPAAIRTMMINEVVPECPEDDFYGSAPAPLYLSTALPLFRRGGLPACSIREVTDAGIYITNAVKRPKRETAVPQEMIEESLPVLERELSLFPNLRAVMLMGTSPERHSTELPAEKRGRMPFPPAPLIRSAERPFTPWGSAFSPPTS